MSESTPRLQLIKPEGSDPFRRQDFLDNFDTLDQNPGVFVASSGTRPAYGAANQGQLIYEADTQRLVARGASGWIPLQQWGFCSNIGVQPGTTVGKGNTHVFDIAQVNLKRPGALLLIGSARVSQQAALRQTCEFHLTVDGADAHWGHSGTVTFADAGSGATGSFAAPFPMYGYRGGLAAGDHWVRVEVSVGTLSNDGVVIQGLKAACLFMDG